MVVGLGAGGESGAILIKGYKLPVIRGINSREPMYSLGTIVNNNVLHTLKCSLKVAERVDLKCFLPHKRGNYVW